MNRRGHPRNSRSRIAEIVRAHFDCRPGALIRELNLLRPIYQKTAAYGHFGRNDPDFAWEKTNKADAVKSAARKSYAVGSNGKAAGLDGKSGRSAPSGKGAKKRLADAAP